MHSAFKTWNVKEESLHDVEMRIHDGLPEDRLCERGQGYVSTLVQRFPWATPQPGSRILEVGSGTGYIMEAALRQLEPGQLIGLDVAEHMIDKARRRLQRDGIADPRIGFLHYDGIHVPAPDNSFDYIYSVAAIQHIPKTYAYHLFFEIHRLLAPHKYAALHLLSFAHLPVQEATFPFRTEVERQLHNQEGHWHHFYSFEELLYVLSTGVGVESLDIQEEHGALWVSFSKGTGVKFQRADLSRETFERRRLDAAAASGAAKGQPSSNPFRLLLRAARAATRGRRA